MPEDTSTLAHFSSAYLASLRSCSDCGEYVEVAKMITKPDSRVICVGCDKRVARLTAKKAQINLFGQQSLI